MHRLDRYGPKMKLNKQWKNSKISSAMQVMFWSGIIKASLYCLMSSVPGSTQIESLTLWYEFYWVLHIVYSLQA